MELEQVPASWMLNGRERSLPGDNDPAGHRSLRTP